MTHTLENGKGLTAADVGDSDMSDEPRMLPTVEVGKSSAHVGVASATVSAIIVDEMWNTFAWCVRYWYTPGPVRTSNNNNNNACGPERAERRRSFRPPRRACMEYM